MKARDIIPGWPRGKSTSGPTPMGPYNLLVYHLALYSLRAKVYAEQVDAEDKEKRRYRAEQQAMVDQYLGHGQMWRSLLTAHAFGLFDPTNRTASGSNLL